MKFLYEYRTPDNEKHSGKINASDKEAAYAALKRQGIKPCRFSEAPGFFNKLFGKGKRWIAIGVLSAVCGVLSVVAVLALRTSRSALSTFDSVTRRQIIGDVAVIEKGIKEGWAEVFPEEGERFLASFAIPGVPAGQRSTTEEEILKVLSAECGVRSGAKCEVRGGADEGIEARQIRAMVEGMKDELREFLRKGGTIAAYGRKLVRRQEEEIAYYNRAKAEIENAQRAKMPEAQLNALWEKRNESLRQMGVKLVPMPE